MKVTLFGASGFIGGNLAQHLINLGDDVCQINRRDIDKVINEGRDLHNIIYAIGMTQGFRNDPLGTVDAHITLLKAIIANCKYSSFTYLSSTRLYVDSSITTEQSTISCDPSKADYIYNISKLMGEALILNLAENGRVLRLSNVYGSDFLGSNFLNSLFEAAITKESVHFHTSLLSSKDFVSIDDVCTVTGKLMHKNMYGIYNVASGGNTTNKQFSEWFNDLQIKVSVDGNAPVWSFNEISISKLIADIEYRPQELKSNFHNLYLTYKKYYETNRSY